MFQSKINIHTYPSPRGDLAAYHHHLTIQHPQAPPRQQQQPTRSVTKDPPNPVQRIALQSQQQVLVHPMLPTSTPEAQSTELASLLQPPSMAPTTMQTLMHKISSQMIYNIIPSRALQHQIQKLQVISLN